jgi:hypothetical protein
MLLGIDEAQRAIISRNTPVASITDVLHSAVWGLANGCEHIGTALSWVDDELKIHIHVLTQIIDSLPEKRDWLDPDIERIARELIAKRAGSEGERP